MAALSIDYGDVPVAGDDSVTSDTLVPLTVDPLANDTDADGSLDPSSVVLTGVGAPSGSTLSADGKTLAVPGEGVWTVDPVTGAITFTPEAGMVGDATPAPYTVSDSDGNVSNPAVVNVNYGSTPEATDDTAVPMEPGPVMIDPMVNDEGDFPLDPTSVKLTGSNAPAGSTLASDGKTLTVPGEGEWTVNPSSGMVMFTPAAGFSGTPTPAGYVISDVAGRTSNEAMLSVSVLPAVDITANDDDGFVLDGLTGATSTASVLDNDTLDGAVIADPALVEISTITAPAPASGSITLNADGTIAVAAGTTPGTYTLVYEICEVANPTNCSTAEVEIVVVDGPTALIDDIEEDLKTILQEDLANTLTMQSRQISGYSADAANQLRRRSNNSCIADVNALLIAENILFDTDKAIIKPESYPVLDALALILSTCPDGAFEIAGHTDSDASDAYNIDLSHRRVVAVRAALTARGVDTSGYVARGYGEREPIASNDTEEGKARNRRVEFRPIDGASETYAGPCENRFSLTRAFSANADENGMNANGSFVSDAHDCITDRREVYEGSLSYIDTEQGQTQSMINLSYRREQYKGDESVFGYFVGMYSSQSDVTRLATGEINGLGLNAGIYGANRLDRNLFLDYYLGAAVGRHEFDLNFDRAEGTIAATGEYQYIAGFAGAALSGEVEFGKTTLAPRVGFDAVYTPGADVDVVAELGGLSQAGGLELDAIAGGRAFAELRADQLINDGRANLWINPRVACYQSMGSMSGVCGYGASFGIESAGDDNELSYALELDGEWGNGYSFGSMTFSIERDLGFGTISGDAGLTSRGKANLGGAFEINF